ncbi:metallophosphoesterase [Bradyrhizobium sp. CCBAU 53338]|uniref:metallophosphoesterase n=1 Tax=Bradyrhizobium sp. CCBAU 53338 TaxID=1325111 RepID=UPI00188D1D3A|nr:metallophosphoesterase [Bradyrhizobium sp. CCBAU 53338]QOZ51578.1 metallophosphoesterase [Bradyrhizobium sp. CCBAU 53338]
MLVWLLSDIHLEMSVWDLPQKRPQFDVLVVAGDLITRAERGVVWLRERFPEHDVVYVAGNHERYGTDFDATIELARAEAAGTRIHVLENEAVTIGDVEFVGCTLWTDFALFGDDTVTDAMRAAEARMNDYGKIRADQYSRKLRSTDTLAAHRRSVAFLRNHCARDPRRRRIIATHHSVDPSALPRAFRHDLAASAYCSNGLELVEELGADCWVSGHIHERHERVVGRTRLISNPKGYGPFTCATPSAWQNRAFDPYFTFEI